MDVDDSLTPESEAQAGSASCETSRSGTASTDREHERRPSLVRCCIAEFFGTFALTFVAAGGKVISSLSRGDVSNAAHEIAPGLIVAALIYAIGDVSGAHFNPVVTLAFAFRRVFEWPKVPVYWLMQFGGATSAALLVEAIFDDIGNVGANDPRFGVGRSFVMEIVLSTFLVFVILNTATRHSLIGSETAIAVGGTIALCGLFAGPVSGASMNPARSFGPAIVAGKLTHLWVYVCGPALGAAVAVAIAWAVHPHRTRGEHAAAQGAGEP